MANQGDFRVCLLLSQKSVQDWLAAALNRMVEETDAEIELLVIARESEYQETSTEPTENIKIISFLQSKFQSITNRNPARSVDISNVHGTSDVDSIECEYISVGEYGVEIPTDVIKQIAKSCDVIIHSGVGILKGDILTATEYGVLGFHHGDLREYRGQPAGFWEFMNDEPTVGITVQRLTETLDAGQVVAFDRVDISDAATWKAVRRRMYDESEYMLVEAIRTLIDSSKTPEKILSDELGNIYYASDFDACARFRSRVKEVKKVFLRI